MRFLIFAFLIFSSFSIATAQGKYFTKKGNISFSSDTPIEKISAENKTATCVLDAASGKVQLAVLIKAFHFEKALMQEHFNENYMESSKFPKATFKGKIENIEDLNLSEDGDFDLSISGILMVHGVSQEVTIPGKLKINDGSISGTTSFNIAVADYGIEIPKVVRDNIAKEVNINVILELEELK